MTIQTQRVKLEAIDIVNRQGFTPRDWPNGPWELTHADHRWALVTDGHLLIAVDRASVDGECQAAPPRAADLFVRYLDGPRTAAQSLAGADLIAFAGKLPALTICETCENKRFVKCEECDGEGGTDCECLDCGDVHERQCKRCKSDGEIACPDCSGDADRLPAMFMGQTVDRRKLGQVLSAVGVDDSAIVEVSVEPNAGASVYVLRGVMWLALLMPMANVAPTVAFEQPETWKRVAVASGAGDGTSTDQAPR